MISEPSISPGTGWVFRIYATLAAVSGFFIFSWGPMWFGVNLPGLPFYRASFVRIAGGVLMTAACFAYALARTEDPDLRRRAFLWFGIGHAVLFLVLYSQQFAIWESPLVDRLLIVVLFAAFVFFYMWSGGDLEVRPDVLQSLFPAPSGSAERLRTSYQRQIRAAALQEERHRLARDLHDSVKQQIFAIGTSAATAQTRFDSDPAGARAALEQVRASAREATAELEAMLDQLRATPLENAGLVAALRQQAEALGFRTGAEVAFEVRALPDNMALAPGAQEGLFRVAQEALANVARHARASRVRVLLDGGPRQLSLLIEDDGGGFDPGQPSGGMGLSNMKQRAAEFEGTFELASSPGGGTRVSVSLPVLPSFNVAEYHRRLAVYGTFAVVHIGGGIWRQSFLYTVLGCVWLIFIGRLVAARSAARRTPELVR
jgi:signal transduction histidine kinase